MTSPISALSAVSGLSRRQRHQRRRRRRRVRRHASAASGPNTDFAGMLVQGPGERAGVAEPRPTTWRSRSPTARLQDPAQYTMAATEAALGAAAHHGHPEQGRRGLPGDHEDAGLTWRDRLPAPVRRVGDTFKSFTPGQKAVTIAAVLALLIGGYFFATWASKPSYAAAVQQPVEQGRERDRRVAAEDRHVVRAGQRRATILVPAGPGLRPAPAAVRRGPARRGRHRLRAARPAGHHHQRLHAAHQLPAGAGGRAGQHHQGDRRRRGGHRAPRHAAEGRLRRRPGQDHGLRAGAVLGQQAALRRAGPGDRAPGRLQRRGPRSRRRSPWPAPTAGSSPPAAAPPWRSGGGQRRRLADRRLPEPAQHARCRTCWTASSDPATPW